MKKVFLLIFIIAISPVFCFAQTIVDADANACEQNSLYFDAIQIEAFDRNERVFAIFRAGRGETESVNAKRLVHVKAFLQQGKSWKNLEAVYARGEKTDGEARIEFYVGGKLFLVTLASKNKTPCLDCCFGGYTDPQNLVKKKKRKMKNIKK